MNVITMKGLEQRDPPDKRIGPINESTDEGFLAMDAACSHKCLDDANVPRQDSIGNTYSLWGRILQYKKSI